MIRPKRYNFYSVEGISQNQLDQHYKLYVNYARKINEIWKILETKQRYDKPNSTYSQMRSLKLGETYALDGVKLHELYFDNITGYKKEIHGDILRLINRDFRDYERFEERFKDIALSMRGWVVLTYEPIDNRLHIIGQDAHDIGSIWMSEPLLVLDVYEHSYMIDFGIDRKTYIDIFFENINWKIVNKRLIKYLKVV